MVTPWAIQWIPSGDAGTQATVATMRALARARSLDPVVRDTAVRIVRYTDGRNTTLQARLLREWIDNRIQFLPDPTLAEAIHDPLDVLATIARDGLARVDCDDVAVMAGALGLAIGLHPRFVVAAYSPSRRYSHVWTEYQVKGGWMPVDPTRPLRAPPPVRLLILPLT